VEVPESLKWWSQEPGGAEWLAALPSMVEVCCRAWGLRLEGYFEARFSYVAQARLDDGTEAVLKLSFPNEDTRDEAAALAFWDAGGAVRLLEREPGCQALLVERLRPGEQLWNIEDDDKATLIAAEVMRRLWRPASSDAPFRRLEDLAARWTVELPRRYESFGRPFERRLLDEAVDALESLGPRQGELVVAHQDLHGGNIVSSGHDRWLAIDPQPVLAEREFDTASLLRDRRWLLAGAEGSRLASRRLDILGSELGLDPVRLRLWGIAHAIAWGMDSGATDPEMVHAARLIAAC
jgi:streptomycin 6-kinase